MRKRRLVHIIESASGGSLKYVCDICNNIGHADWDCTVIYSRRRDTPERLATLFVPEVRLVEVPMVRNIGLINDLRSMSRLKDQLRRLRPDLIHLHSSKAGALGRVAAAQLGIPSVYTPHGFSFFRQDVSIFSRMLYVKLEHAIQKYWPSTMVVGSKNEFEHAKRLGNEKDIKLVPNAVEVPSSPTLLEANSTLVVSVGRLTEAKNPQLVLDIFYGLKKICPDVQFVWVGDGELRFDTENYSKQLGLDLLITGWVPTTEVLRWLRSSRVVVQASKWEGLPFSLLEAMSLARPTVVSNIDAHSDIITHGVNGYIAVQVEDYVQFIRTLMSDVDLSREVGFQAWNTVHKGYSRESFLSAIVAVYQQCLEHKEYTSP